jgi:hypothetical protein
MKTVGIDFEGRSLLYVVVTLQDDGTRLVGESGKFGLDDTRAASAIAAFERGIVEVFGMAAPDRVAFKAKPESGQMRAGAAALKMEAIAMARAPCEVVFVTPQKTNAVADPEGLFAYLKGAYKAAVASEGAVSKAVSKPKVRRRKRD